MSVKHSIVKFKFEDFAGLTQERGTSVKSQIITDCHGNRWRMTLYPRGNTDSPEDRVRISLYNMNSGKADVSARASFIVRDASGKVYADSTLNVYTYKRRGNSGRGNNMIKRSDVLNEEKNILIDGALHVDVHIQIQPDSLVVPPNPLAKNMLIILQDEDSADVQFQVNRQIITAHKCILKPNAPILFEFCKNSREGEKIQIKNVPRTEVFRIVLRYVYTGELPDTETIQKYGMRIIEAADRFGIIPLKMAVETELVRNLVITAKNVTDYLIFAESKTCSLLKEVALSCFVARATDLLNSGTQEKLSESPNLMVELMKEMSKRNDTDTRRFNEYGNLSVNQLRKRLADEELDIDGSKEMLVSRLTDSAKKKRQRTE